MHVTVEQLERAQSLRSQLLQRNEELVVGNQEILDLLLICLLAGGHALLQGEAGSGKTFFATQFAASFDLVFRRIQMSPDLMPSDILGWEVHAGDGDKVYQPGPIYCNFLLADQLNYAPPKLQSSLFEVMEERTVTVSGVSYEQLDPFMTCATIAPTYEQNADYPIVPAQLDRFLMRLTLPLPDLQTEMRLIMADHTKPAPATKHCIGTANDILEYQKSVRDVSLDLEMAKIIAHITNATRERDWCREYLTHGLTPRASIMLKRASQARALLHGRDRVVVEDISELAPHVLAHRLILTFAAEAEGILSTAIIQRIMEEVSKPEKLS